MFSQQRMHPVVRRGLSLAIAGTILLAVAIAVPRAQTSQIYSGNAAARAELERGKKAANEKQPQVAIDAFRKAIDLDPKFVDAHYQFLSATRAQVGYEKRKQANEKLRAVYQELIATQGDNAVFEYFLGLAQDTPDQADAHYLKAIEFDPKYASAYSDLALHADARGDRAAQRSFLKRATEAEPDDPSYAFYYAFSFDPGDRAEWIRLSLDVVKRFPTSERAPQALYWLGVRATSEAEKIGYLERLKREFAPEKFRWSESGMDQLFDAYAQRNPEKALALAREMVSTVSKDSVDSWKQRVAMQEALAQARDLAARGQGAEALSVLEAGKPSRYVNAKFLHLAKANVERGMGQPNKAYERLAALVAAEPVPDLHAALFDVAHELKKSDTEVRADLAARREKLATPAEELALENYTDASKVSLAKYRGKVVLLNFWYPG